MLIATILLIANLVALVFAEPFMSFWWIVAAYVIEIVIYLALIIIFMIIVSIIGGKK